MKFSARRLTGAFLLFAILLGMLAPSGARAGEDEYDMREYMPIPNGSSRSYDYWHSDHGSGTMTWSWLGPVLSGLYPCYRSLWDFDSGWWERKYWNWSLGYLRQYSWDDEDGDWENNINPSEMFPDSLPADADGMRVGDGGDFYGSDYSGSDDHYITCHGMEYITVRAGTFKALHVMLHREWEGDDDWEGYSYTHFWLLPDYGVVRLYEDDYVYDGDDDDWDHEGTDLELRSIAEGTAQGTVVDSDTDQEISGATVKLYQADGELESTETTNDSGFFKFSDADAGSHYLVISKSGYAERRWPSADTFEIPPNRTISQTGIPLLKAPHTVSGWIAGSERASVTLTFTTAGGGLLGQAVSGSDGYYAYSAIPHGWSGTITPSKESCTFTPVSRQCTNITADSYNNNFDSAPVNVRINGWVPGPCGNGAVIVFTNQGGGQLGQVVVGESLSYTFEVPYGWSGSVAPQDGERIFDPAIRYFSDVRQDLFDQNFICYWVEYTISGWTSAADATLTFRDANGTALAETTTEASGFYQLNHVRKGWSGRVVACKPSVVFSPASRDIGPVSGNLYDQNFLPVLSATDLMNHLLGRAALSQDKVASADLNGDGKIDINDLQACLDGWEP